MNNDKLRDAAEKMIQICTTPGLGQAERDIGVKWLRDALAETAGYKRVPVDAPYDDALNAAGWALYEEYRDIGQQYGQLTAPIIFNFAKQAFRAALLVYLEKLKPPAPDEH